MKHNDAQREINMIFIKNNKYHLNFEDNCGTLKDATFQYTKKLSTSRLMLRNNTTT